MLYIVTEKFKYNSISNEDKELFNEIPTLGLLSAYIFLNSPFDTEKINNVLIKNQLKSLAIMPYLSEKQFNRLYATIKDNVELEYKTMNYSFFENLMSGYTLELPVYNTKYVLLSQLIPGKSNLFYQKEIANFNSELERYNLLLKEINVKPTLKDLMLNAINRIMEEEAQSELVSFEDIKAIEDNFFELSIAEFIVQANRHYPTEMIRNFLEQEFHHKEC